MRVWDSLSFFSEASSVCSIAASWRRKARDLLVEHLDLRQRTRRYLLLTFDLAGEFRHLALGGRGAGACTVGGALEPVALAFGDGEAWRTQLRELIFKAGLARLLQTQQFGELGDLRIQAIEGGVFSRPPPAGDRIERPRRRSAGI